MREARSALGVAESARWPSLDLGVGYSRTRASLESRGGAPFFGRRENDLWDAGFDARWELDVFGGARRTVEAATAAGVLVANAPGGNAGMLQYVPENVVTRSSVK